jgi:peptidoglycan/LPS O-acetylase OafA/YrhL
MVLGEHCKLAAGFPPEWWSWWGWLFDGNVGVRCFFFISGYLITWLLAREHDSSGKIRIRDFYARRIVRICPVYFAYLAVLLLLAWATSFHQRPATWIANFTFTTNFAPLEQTSGHLWSLAVEEQFYLLWPFCVVALLRAKRPLRSTLRWLAVPILTAPIIRAVSYVSNRRENWIHSPLLSDYSFFNYFDALALGCMAAILMARAPFYLETLRRRKRAWATLAGVMVLTPYALTRLSVAGEFTVTLGASFVVAGIGILVLQSLLISSYSVRGLDFLRLKGRCLDYVGGFVMSAMVTSELALLVRHPANAVSFDNRAIAERDLQQVDQRLVQALRARFQVIVEVFLDRLHPLGRRR